MNRAIEDSLSLLAGLGVGTALMYLMDPESGEKRRRVLGQTTRQTLGDLGETISDASQNIAQNARSAWSTLSDQMSEQADDASESMSGYGRRLASSASSMARRASEYLPSGLAAASAYLPRRMRYPSRSRSRVAPVAGFTVGGLALVGLGAGLAYMFDPDRGRARRSYALARSSACSTTAVS